MPIEFCPQIRHCYPARLVGIGSDILRPRQVRLPAREISLDGLGSGELRTSPSFKILTLKQTSVGVSDENHKAMTSSYKLRRLALLSSSEGFSSLFVSHHEGSYRTPCTSTFSCPKSGCALYVFASKFDDSSHSLQTAFLRSFSMERPALLIKCV